MAEQKEIAPQEEVGSSTNVDKAVADNRKNVRAARKAPETSSILQSLFQGSKNQ